MIGMNLGPFEPGKTHASDKAHINHKRFVQGSTKNSGCGKNKVFLARVQRNIVPGFEYQEICCLDSLEIFYLDAMRKKSTECQYKK